MNILIRAAVFAAVVVAQPALAQDDAATQAKTLRQAPVGHRQPTVADIEKAQAERGVTGSSAGLQKQSEFDQRLIICQGC